MKTPLQSRAWIEIAAPALRANYRRVAGAVGPQCYMMPMVKGDAYGLGALEVVRVLQPEAPRAWGVATVDEGVALRDGGVMGAIVVFAPVPAAQWSVALGHGLSMAVSDEARLAGIAAEARRLGRRARVHFEVDTGMGRAGYLAAEVLPRAASLRALLTDDAVAWEGVFTHFHSAEAVGGPGMAEQLALFRAALAALDPPAGVEVHLASSAASFRLGAEALGSRPGIFMYGGSVGSDLPQPVPVVSVRACVVRVVEVPAGATVGYGATYSASGPQRWATLAIGYGDGLPRALGNRGDALIGGRRVPLIGRMSMDMTVVNISGLAGVEPGHVATLVGSDGPGEITLDEVAALAGTISYEILTGLSPRLPRVWTEAE